MLFCVTLTTNGRQAGWDAIIHFITRPPYGECFTTVYLYITSVCNKKKSARRSYLLYKHSVYKCGS